MGTLLSSLRSINPFKSFAFKSRWKSALVALVLMVGLFVSIRSIEAPSPHMTLTARFTDVGDLIAGAPVEIADIPVGQVSSISLSGYIAIVKMNVNTSLKLPSSTVAKIERTSVLGEEFVSLAIPTIQHNSSYSLLSNGSTITNTEVMPDLQQVVSAGTQLFGSLNAAQLAELINTSGQAFGGEGKNLRDLIDSFSTVVTGYSSKSAEISQLINNVNQLSSSLAPNSSQNAQAISNLAQTSSILAQNSGQFENLLQSLNDISTQGRSLLETYLSDMNDELASLSATSKSLAQKQQDLKNIIDWLNGQNTTISKDTVDNFVQVLDALVVCGLPNGGSNPSQPANTCSPTGGS